MKSLSQKINEALLNEEKKINSKEEFKEYVDKVLKKAHGDDFDQDIATKLIDDLSGDVENDDWSEAIGRFQSGLGESVDPMNESVQDKMVKAMIKDNKNFKWLNTELGKDFSMSELKASLEKEGYSSEYEKYAKKYNVSESANAMTIKEVINIAAQYSSEDMDDVADAGIPLQDAIEIMAERMARSEAAMFRKEMSKYTITEDAEEVYALDNAAFVKDLGIETIGSAEYDRLIQIGTKKFGPLSVKAAIATITDEADIVYENLTTGDRVQTNMGLGTVNAIVNGTDIEVTLDDAVDGAGEKVATFDISELEVYAESLYESLSNREKTLATRAATLFYAISESSNKFAAYTANDLIVKYAHDDGDEVEMMIGRQLSEGNMTMFELTKLVEELVKLASKYSINISENLTVGDRVETNMGLGTVNAIVNGTDIEVALDDAVDGAGEKVAMFDLDDITMINESFSSTDVVFLAGKYCPHVDFSFLLNNPLPVDEMITKAAECMDEKDAKLFKNVANKRFTGKGNRGKDNAKAKFAHKLMDSRDLSESARRLNRGNIIN